MSGAWNRTLSPESRVAVRQRGSVFQPLTPEQVVWLNQKGYLSDDDEVLPNATATTALSDVYAFVNAVLQQGLPVEMNPFQAICPVCGTPFEVREIGTVLWCPDCGEELDDNALRLQATARPRRQFVLGGHRLCAMSGAEWARLLAERPDFANIALTERLSGADWMYLLLKCPDLAEICRWQTLSPEQWRVLVKAGIALPEWAHLAELSPNEQLSVLEAHPEWLRFVNLAEYDLEEWLQLLGRIPNAGDLYTEWTQLCKGSDCCRLYLDPDFPVERKAQLPAERVDGAEWLRLIGKLPALASFACWKNITAMIRGLTPKEALPLGTQRRMPSAESAFPELWGKREALWRQCGASARGALSRDEFWMLADFMGWEYCMDLPANSPDERVELLSKHPDFGDSTDCWHSLDSKEVCGILKRAPELWTRMAKEQLREAPRELWEQLFAATAVNHAAQRRLAQWYPLKIRDILAFRHYDVIALEHRMLRRWLAAIALVALLTILTLILASC